MPPSDTPAQIHTKMKCYFLVFVSNYILRHSVNGYLWDLHGFVIGRHHFGQTLNVLMEQP